MIAAGVCQGCGNTDATSEVCLDCLARPSRAELATFLAHALGGESEFWSDVVSPMFGEAS